MNTDETNASLTALAQLTALFRQLIEQKFYGTVEAKFESGRVVLLSKKENFKLEYHSNPNLRMNRGENHEPFKR